MPEQTPVELFPGDVYAELTRLAEQAHPALLPAAISRLERYHEEFRGAVPENTRYLETNRRRMRLFLAGNALGPVAFAAAIGEVKIAAATAVVMGTGAVFADRSIGRAGNAAQQRVDVVSSFLEQALQKHAQLSTE
jgi:hypothetical protein